MQSHVLTDDQIVRINNASLQILEKTGVVILHEDMLNRFEDAGASVDRSDQHVRIPAALVASSPASAGKQFTLYGRDMTQTMTLLADHEPEPLPDDQEAAIAEVVAAATKLAG